MLQIVPTMLTNKYSCNTCSSKLNNLDMGAWLLSSLLIELFLLLIVLL